MVPVVINQLQPPDTQMTELQWAYAHSRIMNRGHGLMVQADLTLSPLPFSAKSHFLWVYITHSQPILQELCYITFGFTAETLSSSSSEWAVGLFFSPQSQCYTRIYKQSRFATLWIQNILDCISVKTFHNKHDLSWGQGKLKVGQNNKHILYE